MKIKILRKKDTSHDDPILVQGQPYIDMTQNPGHLYVGQGEGTLDESEIEVYKTEGVGHTLEVDHASSVSSEGSVKDSGNAEATSKLSVPRDLQVNLESNNPVSFDGSGDALDIGVTGILKTGQGGFDSDKGAAKKFSTRLGMFTSLEWGYDASFTGAGETRLGLGESSGILQPENGGTGISDYSSIGIRAGKGDTTEKYTKVTHLGSTKLETAIENGDFESVSGFTGDCSYSIIGDLWIANIEWLHMLARSSLSNDILQVDLKGWLGDIMDNVTITGVSAIAYDVASSGLSYNYTSNRYCTYIDNDNKMIYIGQDRYTSNYGVYILAMGIVDL